MRLFGFEIGRVNSSPATESDAAVPAVAPDVVQPQQIAFEDMQAAAFFRDFQQTFFDGDKFFGGFGPTQIQIIDYWKLRARSAQLFNSNLYGRGIIRRLITNEINTGLALDAFPDEQIIEVEEDSLQDWTETVENRFIIWGKNPQVCDWRRRDTFGAIQRAARTEALVNGDVLVVLRQSQRTKLPMVQLVNGNRVKTPLIDSGLGNLRKGHVIKHGVELNTAGRIVAFWVQQDDLSFKRLPAFGEKSGRRLAWLVYGTDKRLDEVRGQPLLALVLQSLKEIDRYRDSVQRKAVLNSLLALFIKKGEAKLGTTPFSASATRKDTVNAVDSNDIPRKFDFASQIPGIIIEELQQGEEPVGFDSKGTDINFGEFEAAIIQAIGWALEIPPEILRLSFSNNYSASQAAINEFKTYLNGRWVDWGETFCDPIYIEWLVSQVLLQKIDAPGLLAAWRDPAMHDVFGAWTLADWYGSIKPSTDMLKQAKGSKILVENAWSTNAREARLTTGTKFTKNIKRLKRENELLTEALRPLAEFQQEFPNTPVTDTLGASAVESTEDVVLELLDDRGLEQA